MKVIQTVLFIYLSEIEKGRERFSLCWFTLQVATISRAVGLGQRQEPGTPMESPP